MSIAMRHGDSAHDGGVVTPAERGWRLLFLVGAAAATISLAGAIFDIGLAMVPGWDTTSAPQTTQGWLIQLATSPWLGVRNLDLLNLVTTLVGLPMFVAVLAAHRRTEPGASLLASVFVGLGAVVFVGNNVALPMLELAQQYATAATAERTALVAAASALLARGAHGTLGAFPGFLLCEAGTLLTAVVMLRGRVFGRTTAWMGVIGSVALMAYTVLMTFSDVSPSLVLAFATPGGLLMIAWQASLARVLWRTGRAERAQALVLQPEG